MKIAITGASGHLGASIVRELLEQGHEVRALVRDDQRSIENLNVEKIKGDILSPETLSSFLKGVDALIHAAAYISIHGGMNGLVHQTNVTGTSNLIKAAIANKVKKMIHFSSIHAFQQEPTHEVLNEKRTYVTKHAFAYDYSKLQGQQLVMDANGKGIDTIILNPTAIIGPLDFKPSLLGKSIIDMINGKIPAVIDGGFDFCDARDIAKACCNALVMGRYGENYLLGGKWDSMKNFSKIVGQASGKNIQLKTLPVWMAKAGLPFVKTMAHLQKKEPLYTNEAIAALVSGNRKIVYDKAKIDLGYTSRPLQETMQDTVNWFKQNGFI